MPACCYQRRTCQEGRHTEPLAKASRFCSEECRLFRLSLFIWHLTAENIEMIWSRAGFVIKAAPVLIPTVIKCFLNHLSNVFYCVMAIYTLQIQCQLFLNPFHVLNKSSFQQLSRVLENGETHIQIWFPKTHKKWQQFLFFTGWWNSKNI